VLKKTQFGPQALRFRIELQNLLPPIWREILVPSSYSFWDLHVAIQDSMGWLDYHLHAFRLPDSGTGENIEIGIPGDEWIPERTPTLAGWEILVRSYMNEPGQQVDYEYDIGDGWQHRVLLKEIVPYVQGKSYPVCVGGERACPPEDCGGTWGYQSLLEAINDPAHEEHQSMLEWLGGEFDSEHFDPGMVNFDDPKKRWKHAFERRG
jgi:hypothetical protein